MTRRLSSQSGFSAIIAVVLIVLFALLGTYMASMSSLGVLSTTQSGSAIRAWFAARSGVEWAVHRSLAASDGGCTCASNCCSGIDGTVLNFSEGGLNGYSATVTCASASVTEGPANYCVYNLGVVSTNNNPQQTLASRTIRLSITDRNAP